VAAVAVRAGLDVARPIAARAVGSGRIRALSYALVGALAAALLGPWLVLVLLGCGAAELARRGLPRPLSGVFSLPIAAAPAGLGALAWMAFKVGALAFGGGFVIVPLLQADAVGAYHWMTHAQFLNAVALGQVTPGPVVVTVGAVGYAADGLPGGLLAALLAFAPSFSFILLGAARFDRLLISERVQAFLAGAAPAAAGAIVGAALPLASALSQGWQFAVLAAAAALMFLLRRGVVSTLLLAGCAGLLVGVLGGPLPH
jgi:chromate transporter